MNSHGQIIRKLVIFFAKSAAFVLAGIVGFAFVLLITLNFLLDSPSITQKILDSALPPVGKLIKADIKVKSFRIRFAPFHLILEDCALNPLGGRGAFERDFAGVKKVVVELDSAALLRGKVKVTRVDVTDPWCYLKMDADGNILNLPFGPLSNEEKPKKPPPVIKLPIYAPEVRVLSASFKLDMPQVLIVVDKVDVNARANLDTGDTGALVKIKGIQVKPGDLDIRVSDIDLDTDFSLHTWGGNLRRMLLTMDGVTVAAQGWCKDVVSDNLTTGGTVQVNASDLGMVNRMFVSYPPLSGKALVEAKGGFDLEGIHWYGQGKVRVEEAVVDKLPVPLAELQFSGDPKAGEVKSILVRAAGGQITGMARQELEGNMTSSAHLNLAGINLQAVLAGFRIRNQVVSAAISGELHAGAKLRPHVVADVDTNITASGLIVHGKDEPIVKLNSVHIGLIATYQGDTVEINKASIGLAGGEVKIKGSFKTNGSLAADVAASFSDLSALGEIDGNKVAGSIDVNADISGNLAHLQGPIRVMGSDLEFRTFHVGQLLAQGNLTGSGIDFSELNIIEESSSLVATGSFDWADEPTLNMNAEVRNGKIEDFMAIAGAIKKQPDQKEPAISPFRGEINLFAQAQGNLKALTGKADVQVSNLQIGNTGEGNPVERVSKIISLVRLDQGRIFLDDLTIQKEKNAGTESTKRERETKVLESKKKLKNKAKEMQPKPEEMQAQNYSWIRAKGYYFPDTGEISADLSTEGLDERSFDYLAAKDIPFSGLIRLSANIAGTISSLKLQGSLSLRDAYWGEALLGASEIVASTNNDQIVIKGDLLKRRLIVKGSDPEPEDFTSPSGSEMNLGTAKLSAAIGAGEGHPLSGELALNDLEFASLITKQEPATPQEVEDGVGYGGYITGKVVFQGMLNDPATLAMNLLLDEIRFSRGDFAILNLDQSGNKAPVQLGFAGGKLHIDSLKISEKTLIRKGGHAKDDLPNQKSLLKQKPQGSAPLYLEVRSDSADEFIEMSMHADMGVLRLFTPMIADASGDISLNARVPSSLDFKGLQGDLKVDSNKDDYIQPRSFPTPIEGLQLAMIFSGGTATIQNLNANIGGGTMWGAGNIVFSSPDGSPPAVNIHIQMKEVRTGYAPSLDATLDRADIVLHLADRTDSMGNVKGQVLELQGEVAINQATLSQNFDLVSILKSFRSTVKVSGAEVYKGSEENLRFNIALSAPDSVYLENNFAQMEFGVNLILVGSDKALGMEGMVEVLQGTANVLDHKYEITSAQIQFYDQRRIYPNFDVNAQTSVNDIEIFINVSGNPDRYEIQFTSDPPKSQQDIVALLSLGVDYAKFQAEGAGASSNEAAMMAAQSLINQQLSSVTGTRRVEVGIDTSTGTERLKTQVEVRKNIYLSLYRDVVDSNISAEMEYAFYRHLSILGSYSTYTGNEPTGMTTALPIGAGLRLNIDFP